MLRREQIHSLDKERSMLVVQPTLLLSLRMAAFEAVRMFVEHELPCKIPCPWHS